MSVSATLERLATRLRRPQRALSGLSKLSEDELGRLEAAIDLAGVAGSPELATSLEVAAADNLKRVRRAPAAEPDWTADPGLAGMTAFVETKTVWHPIGV